MPHPARQLRWKWLIYLGFAVFASLVAGLAYWNRSAFLPAAEQPLPGEAGHQPQRRLVHVEVIHPIKGAMDRTTIQPGTVQAYQAARLFAEVPGYLKTQNVDIGDRVKRGQVLATVDVPELEKQVKRYAAGVEQAQAKVAVMNARAETARAELEVAKAAVFKFEAASASAAATCKLREKQLKRYKELLESNSIDERLVDEKEEQRDAAVEAERAARAAILTAKSEVLTEEAKIRQAVADINDANAAVKVAQAEFERAEVLVKFATIVSPYDGVVTERNYFPGDFVKAATEGGSILPMFTVERTDKMRVVVQIPDRDVPYTDPGDPATVEIDALPGQKFEAKVSRIASSEDAQTRLMRVEIDLPNPTGKIRKGMYGRVFILLDKSSDLLSLPTTSLAGKIEEGKASVFVVRDGKVSLVPVKVGTDNGLRIEIISGLKETDDVVLQPTRALNNGTEVEAKPIPEPPR
jgi:RND family efflux transporter MFP subunit